MEINATQINSVDDFINVVLASLTQLVDDVVGFIPELVAALVIWYLGSYLIDLGVKVLDKMNLKDTHIDDKFIGPIKQYLKWVGKFVLALIVLDYLGIGRSVVAAVAQGFTFAIAIAFGLAFGRALEPDAERIVKRVRRVVKK